MTRRPDPRRSIYVELPPDLDSYLAQRADYRCCSKAAYVRGLLVADRETHQQSAAAARVG